MGDDFGSLAWNADLGWWSGSTDVSQGHRIDLHIEAANDQAAMREAAERARPMWGRLRVAEPSIRATVASQMTIAHNDYCDPDDEVTPEQFADRLRLLSAKFEESGAVELVYSDGLLFGGHWIIVPVGKDGTLGEASEAG
jgi:hypothetical protein